MDEIDNEALSVLMILDDELFPQLLEWSASKGWSDLVIFLLETDYLRFKTNDMFESEPDKTGLYEPYYLIQKNTGGCFDQFFTTQQMDSLKRLIDSGIPLNSVYSQICASVWKEMLIRTGDITHSTMWPTVRRNIVEHHEINIEDMLADVMKRKYFDRYIQADACDLAALQCLLSVRRIFAALSPYKEVHNGDGATHESVPGTNTNNNSVNTAHNTTSSSGMFSYFGNKNNDENASIMRRWKASKNAIVSASKALQAPFATSVHSNSANNTSNAQINTQHEYYTDPFEAFKILLEGTRQLQKQFFPSSTNLTTQGGAFNAHSNGTTPRSHAYTASPRSHHTTDTMSDSTISPPGQPARGSGRLAYVPGHNNPPQARNCSGISEALRIEIQSTLTVNASVRSREIETVDRAFAFACANVLDRQLHALETEMLTYISTIFAEFQHTNDYALMVAQTRALQCRRITDYNSKLEFLYDRVRQQKIVSWKDSHTRGKVFVAYDRLTIEGEETSSGGDSESKSSPDPYPAPISPFSPVSSSQGGSSKYAASSGPSTGVDGARALEINASNVNVTGKPNAQELDRQGRFNPNVVAISLEIVLPHTTMLSPTNVASCSHRVSLYAGGKRRATRLRAAVPPTAPAESAVMTAQSALNSVVTAASKLNVRSFLGNIMGSSSDSAVGHVAAAGTTMVGVNGLKDGRSVDVYDPPASPTKSPMRRVGSVQFQLTENTKVVEDRPVELTPDHVVVPVVSSEPDQEFRRADRSSSLDSVEHDGDTLSDLPVMGIASSIKVRNISNANDIGTGGSSIFNDIVNSGPSSGSGKYNVGGSFFEDVSTEQGDDDNSSEGSLSEANSDSSSDYEGDVRHVFSTTDLDQLIRMGDTPGTSPRDLAPRSIETPYRAAGSRVPSMRNFSRVGSNASIQTGMSAFTRHTSGIPATTSYDTGVRKVAAIDLVKLDRCLHRDVLGTTRALPPNSAASKHPPLSSGAKAQQAVKTKHLVASLAVALAGVFCDHDGFGRKFTVPVEESFTFTTDTKGLELLNDLIYSKQASYMGTERTESYIQAFEKVTSVFRQNSMLDTARPVFRVCVQIQSEVIAAPRAAAVKLQLAQLNQLVAKGGVATPRSAPLHPSHGAHTVASRIPHSHVRIGVSYSQLTPQHAMISTLSSIAFTACDVIVSGSAGTYAAASSDTIGSDEKKTAEVAPATGNSGQDLVPLPLKLRYTDSFVEFIIPPAPKPHVNSQPKESIYELYLGTLPPLNDDGTQAYLRGSTLCEPITRHVGLCDFSLSETVTSLSTRLMLQILMLVLVDRPVMLISSSSTLLSKVQAAIPRLIWPFRIENTHVVRQILSGAELHHFVYRHDVPFVSETQQPTIRDKKLNRKTSSWRETISRIASNVGFALSPGGHSTNDLPTGLRSPRGSFTRQRKSSSSGDLVAGMLKRPVSSTGSILGSDDGNYQSGTNSPIGLNQEPPSPGPENKTYQRILTPPSLQLPTPLYGSENGDEGPSEMQIDQHSCILGVDASAFYSAPTDLREELEAMRIRGSGFTIIDIDLGVILNRRPDEFCEDDNEAPPKPLPSRLSDPEIFRCSNFGIYRSLVKTVNQVQAHLLKSTRALLNPTSEEELDLLEPEYVSSRLAEKIVLTNREVEKAFYAFWSEMVLRALPKNIQHFPGPKVISCDIRAVLTELLHTVVASSASMDMGEDVEDMYLASGENESTRVRSLSIRSTSTTSEASMNPSAAVDPNTTHYFNKQLPAALPDSAMFDHMNKLPFEEFLALFVEQVANHGETNMCYAFFKEFIADGSVVFKDLLMRHSAVLDRWSM